MKKLYGICLLLASTAVLAQSFQDMSADDMQKMMQEAQKTQACMANVDQYQLKELEEKGRKLEAEIKALCAAGKRDEALSTAIREGQKLSNDPAVMEMRKCSELMPDISSMMPKIPYADAGDEKDKSGKHICD